MQPSGTHSKLFSEVSTARKFIKKFIKFINLLTLEYRRRRGDMLLVYKLMNKLTKNVTGNRFSKDLIIQQEGIKMAKNNSEVERFLKQNNK